MKKLIVYSSHDEVLVCQPSDEKTLLKEWFKNGGRNTDNYDRTEITGILDVSSVMHIQS